MDQKQNQQPQQKSQVDFNDSDIIGGILGFGKCKINTRNITYTTNIPEGYTPPASKRRKIENTIAIFDESVIDAPNVKHIKNVLRNGSIPVEAPEEDVVDSVPSELKISKIFFNVEEKKLSASRERLMEKTPKLAKLFNGDDTEITIDFSVMEQNYAELLNVSSEHKLDNLKQFLCENLFDKSLDHETVINYLLLAFEHELEDLKKKACEYIKKHPEIEETQEFEDKIINSDDSEMRQEVVEMTASD